MCALVFLYMYMRVCMCARALAPTSRTLLEELSNTTDPFTWFGRSPGIEPETVRYTGRRLDNSTSSAFVRKVV